MAYYDLLVDSFEILFYISKTFQILSFTLETINTIIHKGRERGEGRGEREVVVSGQKVWG